MSQNTIITKSDYLAYLDAPPRHLWAAKHTVEQLPLDPLAQHQMEDGKRVEKLAYDYLAEWVKSRPACRLLYQQSFSDGPPTMPGLTFSFTTHRRTLTNSLKSKQH